MTDLSELKITVTGDDSDAQQKLSGLRQTLSDTGQEMNRLSDAGRQAATGEITVGTSAQQSVAGIRTLRSELEGLKTVLADLQNFQTGAGGPGAIPQIDEKLNETKQRIADLEQEMQRLQAQARAATQQMSAGFVGNAASVDELRSHLEQLLAVQARGAEQGLFTPGLAQEISRTESALKAFNTTTAQTSVQFGIVRSTVSVLDQEIMRMLGVNVPGLAQLEGAAAGVADKFAVTGGASSVAVFGITAVGAAAVTATAALTVMGAKWEEAQAQIAITANVTVQQAHEIGLSFEGLRQGGESTAQAYSQVAGQLTVYNGAALTTQQATDFMRTATEGADASGQKLGSTAKALAEAMIATHTPLDQANQVMNVLYQTSLNTGIPMEQVAQQFGRIEERAGGAGPSLRGMGEALTIATAAGIDNGRSLQLVDTLIGNLADKTSPQAQQALQRLHAQIVTNSAGQLDYVATLQSLRQGFDGIADPVTRDALATAIAGQSYHALFDILGVSDGQIRSITSSYEDHNRVAQDAGTRTGTAAERFGQLATQAKDAAGNIGADLNQALGIAGDAFNVFGSVIDGLSTPAKIALGLIAGPIQTEAQAIQQLSAPTRGPLSRAQYYAQLGLQEDGKTPLSPRDTSLGAGGLTPSFGGDQAPSPLSSTYDYTAAQQRAQQLAEMGAEGRRLNEAAQKLMELEQTPGPLGANDEKVREQKDALLSAAKEIEQAWQSTLARTDPAEYARRVGLIDQAVDTLNQGVDGATTESIANLDSLMAELGRADTQAKVDKANGEDAKRAAADAKRAADEAARQQRASFEADPLLGIRQSMQKDRDDLIGTAGSVMADLQNAVALKGQQGARAAGEAFGQEARKWGEELQKAGVPGWEDAFNHLMALAETAVVTGSPDVLAAIHQMLAQGEASVRDAEVGRAMAEVMAKAGLEVLEGQNKFDDQLAGAAASAADARLTALQSEGDREYDVWASHQVDMLNRQSQFDLESQRLAERRSEEDIDRAEERGRALADLDEQQHRAEQDRATQAARTLADLQSGQSRSVEETNRARRREDADASHEHDERLKQIGLAGGSDVAKRLADENASYQQQVSDRARKRQEDDAESTIKREEQLADAQKRISEQRVDAQRRASEQAVDLAKRQGEQDADLGKTRGRQDVQRQEQVDDELRLNGPGGLREQHEQAFHVDAEAKAQQRFLDDQLRIDAKYQHEVDAALGAQAQIEARAEHERISGGIDAQARAGQITPDERESRLDDENERFTQQTASLQAALREQETAVNAALRDAIAGDRQHAANFPGATPPAPQSIAFPQLNLPSATGGGAPTTGAGFNPVGGFGGFGSITVQVVLPDGTPAEQGEEIGRGIYRALAGASTRTGAGGLPATG